MRHAQAETLGQIEDLLQSIRKFPALTERKPGTFYRKSVAFLHFHEDPLGIFADLKNADGTWQRLAVQTTVQKQFLLDTIEKLSV